MHSHIRLNHSKDHENVIVCGAPERAERFAGLLKGAKPLAKNREYHSYLGDWEGRPILVTSHGVGASGAGICFQELVDAGAKKIIRLGTTGGLQSGQKVGDIILVTGAAREEGVSRSMAPEGLPALADLDLTWTMREFLRAKSVPFTAGIAVASDIFYPGKLPSKLPLYKECGALSVEMECSALFIIGQLRDIRTGSLLVISDLIGEKPEGVHDPASAPEMGTAFDHCFRAAAESLTRVKPF